MNDIIQQFQDYELIHAQEKQKKDELGNREREAAEEFRKASLETFRETQNRNGDEPPTKKKRRSESETVAYLREKNQSNMTLQKEQLAVQKQELELRKQQMDNFNQLILNQQNQTNALFQQQ